MAKWNDEGENRMLNIMFGATAVENYYLGLYKDVAEPGESDGISEITEVTVADGYARIVLTRGSWASITADLATYAEQTFTASGGDWGDVTGAFLTEGASGDTLLISVQHFASARPMNDGDQLKVTPKVRAA